MLNFNFSLPTKLFFGKDSIKDMGSEILKYSDRVLLIYGGGSIKKNGIYDKTVEILKSNNIFYKELAGVHSNPRVESVKEGIKLVRDNNLEFILAVGGGSVIDCGKGIAAGVFYEGDVWDLYQRKAGFNKAVPLGAVLTLSATGTEMNGNSVVSNLSLEEKLHIGSDLIVPKFSVLDPTYTYSVDKYYTSAGVVDIMSHIFEQYFSPTKDTFIQDRMAESILKTVVNYGEKVLLEPENYDARANIMWAGTIGLNGILGVGKQGDWATHGIEHELSGIYDVTHGVGLSAITPYWMDYVLNEENKDRFITMGKNVFGIEGDNSITTARKTIKAVKDYFASLGVAVVLGDIIDSKENIEKMAEGAVRFGNLGGLQSLGKDDIVKILEAAYEGKLK
jgi:butanol dehydrogenase